MKEHDYSQPGEYFVTICTHNHECTLGEIVNGEMRLNEIGKIAEEEWLRTAIIRPDIQLDVFVIMPNHIHGIIILTEPVGTRHAVSLQEQFAKPVGVQNFEPLPQNIYQHIIPKSLGSIIRSYKAAVTHECRKCGHHGFRWQRNFFDRVIRSDKELINVRDYIANNVLQWSFDSSCDVPDNLFLTR